MVSLTSVTQEEKPYIPTTISIRLDTADEMAQFLTRLGMALSLANIHDNLHQHAAWVKSPIKSEDITRVVSFKPVVDRIGNKLRWRVET